MKEVGVLMRNIELVFQQDQCAVLLRQNVTIYFRKVFSECEAPRRIILNKIGKRVQRVEHKMRIHLILECNQLCLRLRALKLCVLQLFMLLFLQHEYRFVHVRNEEHANDIDQRDNLHHTPVNLGQACPRVPSTKHCDGDRCCVKHVVNDKQDKFLDWLVKPREAAPCAEQQVTVALPDET